MPLFFQTDSRVLRGAEVCSAFLTEAEMLRRVSMLQTNVSIA